MELLHNLLPIILSILGIVLLVILIVIGIKVIKLMNNIDEVVKDITFK